MIYEKQQKYLNTLINAAYFAFILSVLFLLKLYIFPIFMPFIIAFILSAILEPLVRYFECSKMGRGASTILSMSIVISAIIGFFSIIITRVSAELIDFSSKLPTYVSDLYLSLESVIKQGENFYLNLSPELLSYIEAIITNTSSKLITYAGSLSTSLLNTITFVPGAVFGFIVMMIATFFFTKDKAMIYDFIKKQVPHKQLTKYYIFKSKFLGRLLSYLKAMGIIMSVTFTEVFIGLNIMHVRYALLLAILIAFVDILPVLGTGTILWPWIASCLITKNYSLAISLSILWVIVMLIRYLIEPKVVGNELGLHPIVILSSIYVGIQIFGVVGVILGPVSTILFLAAQDVDAIPKFK